MSGSESVDGPDASPGSSAATTISDDQGRTFQSSPVADNEQYSPFFGGSESSEFLLVANEDTLDPGDFQSPSTEPSGEETTSDKNGTNAEPGRPKDNEVNAQQSPDPADDQTDEPGGDQSPPPGANQDETPDEDGEDNADQDEDGPGTQQAAGDQCTDWQWHNEWWDCLESLPDAPEVECAEPPKASSPESGMAGWFAEPTKDSDKNEALGMYTKYGYAGYQLPMYGSKAPSVAGTCVDILTLPNGADAANSMANLQFNLATATTGASNSMRQYAWEPGTMWGWSNEFLENGTTAVYERVFSVFGAVTLAIVGVYLLWRSRQAEMSTAVTTTAWAALIMVLVIAVAKWPTEAAGWADKGLTTGLNVSTGMLPDEQAEGCLNGANYSDEEYEERKENNPHRCIDTRSGAIKASDMVVDKVLYENWLRSMVGQGSEYDPTDEEDEDGNPVVQNANTAYKYGPALYWAQAMTWTEQRQAEDDPSFREEILQEKQTAWRNLAAQIQKEDPEAYSALIGERAWERTGTAFLALLTAVFFSLFDLTSSFLIILGFMVVRFAVIALPIIGTIALLKPAGGPFKRLVNIVLASIINVMVFAVAAVVYLYAASLILQANLPSWLQIVLIALVGLAAWMLLRPFRRLASMQGAQGAKDTLLGRSEDRDNAARRQARDTEDINDNVSKMREQNERRPETRTFGGQNSGQAGESGRTGVDQSSAVRDSRPTGFQAPGQSSSAARNDVYRPSGG
ncbi:hypothetical protein [Salininema proteolyticum]|uniref:MFS transporter n=1 Tax=Salininema proteolyticum TaxID=1607685 RepID=A0ABV8U350_9ACTN